MKLDRREVPDGGPGLEPSLLIEPASVDEIFTINLIFWRMTTSAVAQARRPGIRISQIGRRSYGFSSIISASTVLVTTDWLFARGAGTFSASSGGIRHTNPLPRGMLFSALVRIDLLTQLLDAGDEITDFTVEIVRGTKDDLAALLL